MLREHGVDDLWDDRLVVPDNAGKQRLAGAQLPQQIVAEFVPDGTVWDLTGVDCRSEVAERVRSGHDVDSSMPLTAVWRAAGSRSAVVRAEKWRRASKV